MSLHEQLLSLLKDMGQEAVIVIREYLLIRQQPYSVALEELNLPRSVLDTLDDNGQILFQIQFLEDTRQEFLKAIAIVEQGILDDAETWPIVRQVLKCLDWLLHDLTEEDEFFVNMEQKGYLARLLIFLESYKRREVDEELSGWMVHLGMTPIHLSLYRRYQDIKHLEKIEMMKQINMYYELMCRDPAAAVLCSELLGVWGLAATVEIKEAERRAHEKRLNYVSVPTSAPAFN